LALRVADADSTNRDAHLAEAERAYREALLLNPRNLPAKWNLELAVRHRGGGSSRSVPPAGGGGGGPSSGGGQGRATPGGGGGQSGGWNQAQAEQILRSIGHRELQTRPARTRRPRPVAAPRAKA